MSGLVALLKACLSVNRVGSQRQGENSHTESSLLSGNNVWDGSNK